MLKFIRLSYLCRAKYNLNTRTFTVARVSFTVKKFFKDFDIFLP
jgi:hypothetical protein